MLRYKEDFKVQNAIKEAIEKLIKYLDSASKENGINQTP